MQDTPTSLVLSFLNRCFREDKRGAYLLDFLNSNRVEFVKVFEGQEELLNGLYPKQALPEAYGKKIHKATQLYAKEKTLYYASVFVVGETKLMGERRPVFAPVVICPAEVSIIDGEYFVSLNHTKAQLNTSILGLLGFEDREDVIEFQKGFPSFPFDFGAIGKIARLFNSCVNDFDTADLFAFPSLWHRRKLSSQTKNLDLGENGYKLVPMSTLGLVSNSDETYGINAELDELLETEDFNDGIEAIYGGGINAANDSNEAIWLPTVLSAQQEKAVLNARTQLLSLIIGPPGTGKSYTIAAIAVDHVLRGQSVLIVSRQDEAVNVVGNKIAELLGSQDLIVRAGAKRNLTHFKKRLRNLLRRSTLISNAKFSKAEADLNRLKSKIEKTEVSLRKSLKRELKIGKLLTKDGFLSRLQVFAYLKLSWRKASIAALMTQLNVYTDDKIKLVNNLISFKTNKQVNGLLKYHRNVLEKLYQSLRAKVSSEREQIFDNINHSLILKAFPVWLSKLSELYSSVPLDKELFDVVIIDEASQVDLVTPLPALYRAKKIVVCGDPNQLRHYSFLSRPLMQQFKEIYNLGKDVSGLFNYRDISILDLLSLKIKSNNQLAFLDEHFRSVPEIINFSNKNFYNSELKIMTERPRQDESTGLFNYFVSGQRNAKGTNEIEANFIIEAIKKITKEEAEFENFRKSSIGVLAPLTDQAKYLQGMAMTRLTSEEISAHSLRVGTPFSFQGEEKDIMFLSMAVDTDSHHSAFAQLNKPDVFNVSITRAKRQQHIVYSIQPENLPSNHLLRNYLETQSKNLSPSTALESPLQDEFYNSVKDIIKQLGLNYWISYSIAGVEIDFLVESDTGLKAIDLVGFTGAYADYISISRCKILSRAQVPVYLLAYSEWKKNRENVEREVLNFLAE